MKKVSSMFDLTGRVVVITGGAGLLGPKHGEAVAEYGGIPVLLDIHKSRAEEKAADIAKNFGVPALGMGGDVTRKESVEAVKEELEARFGHIDALINNAANDPKVTSEAGQVPWSRFEQFSEDVWHDDIAVGLTGAFLCSQVFGEGMARRGKGVIINIASDLGVIAPDQRIYEKEGAPKDRQPVKPVTYSVVKHGLIGLTKYLATYWATEGVRVNAISPSGVFHNHPQEFVDRLSRLIPMGRMADIDEYKAAIVFLVSDASSYMTGSNVIIDGGKTCW
ncbi:MAG: oxidoreductase [Candidatus Magasanikbacteria bacterium RIFCSPHIGHO2_02_FULL_51_14]|uniref:Oxidoreductase n=1 Tax=Candidatus Magasanikbacteria bacterium RIFCSPHIGHO2_02_FULL_51_14 TaxID=1798683 RepID=A0A1F6MD32_9BACT|nr:MAG: oxidoreductase [Candidatus Magasanikbacteria bacterium RIFCSPHIGHO2_02_FULL_51_14]